MRRTRSRTGRRPTFPRTAAARRSARDGSNATANARQRVEQRLPAAVRDVDVLFDEILIVRLVREAAGDDGEVVCRRRTPATRNPRPSLARRRSSRARARAFPEPRPNPPAARAETPPCRSWARATQIRRARCRRHAARARRRGSAAAAATAASGGDESGPVKSGVRHLILPRWYGD